MRQAKRQTASKAVGAACGAQQVAANVMSTAVRAVSDAICEVGGTKGFGADACTGVAGTCGRGFVYGQLAADVCCALLAARPVPGRNDARPQPQLDGSELMWWWARVPARRCSTSGSAELTCFCAPCFYLKQSKNLRK